MSKAKRTRNDVAKAALLRRIADVYSGACGYKCDDGNVFIGAEELSRIIPVLESIFGTEDNGGLWSSDNLSHFDTPQNAADALFTAGVRA